VFSMVRCSLSPEKRGLGRATAPDTNRRSLRSLRSDRDDSKERGVAVYTFVSLDGTFSYRVPDSPHAPGFLTFKVTDVENRWP
jgi:hypothetical protein